MKTLLTLLLLIPSLSWGKMISIKDYINSVSDLKNNEMFYLTARCNSLYTIIEGVSNGYPELKEASRDARDKTAMLIILLADEIHPNETDTFKSQMSANLVKGMVKNYSEIVNQSYINTGNYMNDFLLDDFEVCGTLLSEL